MGMNSIFTETNPGNNHSFLAFLSKKKAVSATKYVIACHPIVCIYY